MSVLIDRTNVTECEEEADYLLTKWYYTLLNIPRLSIPASNQLRKLQKAIITKPLI